MNQFKFYLVQAITTLRFIGIPLIFFIENKYILFLYASFLFLTDFIDGYLARKWKVTSTFGAIMDLLADKTIVIVLLINAALLDQITWILVGLIAFREIYSMVLRFKNLKEDKPLIKANMVGKTKTAFQMSGLALLMLQIPLIGNVLLWISVGLSYYSFLDYFKEYKAGK